MKTSIILACVLCAAGVRAAVIAYDGFEDAPVGAIAGLNGGTGFTSEYLNPKQTVTVVEHSLGYANGEVNIGGGAKCMRLANSADSNQLWGRMFPMESGSPLYMSFLLYAPTADGGKDDDFFSLTLSTSTSEGFGVHHRLNAAVGDHAFGFRRVNTDPLKSTIATDPSEVYFVVLKLSKLPGSNFYNEWRLYVNPSTATEPEEPSLILTNSTSNASFSYLTARLASQESGDYYYLDNMALTTTFFEALYPAEQYVVAPAIDGVLAEDGRSWTVTMACGTLGATIWYTTDGSEPSPENGLVYTEALVFTSSCALRAMAVKAGAIDSPAIRAAFAVESVWTGGGSDDNWQTVENWNALQAPGGGDLVFDETAQAGTEVNNRITQNTTVASLSYIQPNGWHRTEIAEGYELKVDGGTLATEHVVLLGGSCANGGLSTSVKMSGGGSFAIDAPDGSVLLANNSTSAFGYVQLDLRELSAFSANVDTFWVGRQFRTQTDLYLPAVGEGRVDIQAKLFAVADGYGSSAADSTHPCDVRLGTSNRFAMDDFYIAASKSGERNTQSGKVTFRSTGGDLTLCGLTGEKANVTIASNNGFNEAAYTYYSIDGLLDLRNGTVAAQLGRLLIGEGRGYYSTATRLGGVQGTFAMNAGTVAADEVVLAVGLENQVKFGGPGVNALLQLGPQSVFTAGSLRMAEQNTARAAQNLRADLVIDGGRFWLKHGAVTGIRTGNLTNQLVSAFTVCGGGVFESNGSIAPAEGSTNVTTELYLSGSTFVVTNAAHTAEFRVEQGLLSLTNGTLVADSLVTTNGAVITEIILSGTATGEFPQIIINDSLKLGGTLKVTLNDYKIRGGEVWKITTGSGVREGTFANLEFPDEHMRVLYKENGYWVDRPAEVTVLQLR